MEVESEKQLVIQFQYGFGNEELIAGQYSDDEETPWHIDYMNLRNCLTLYFRDDEDTDVLACQLSAPGKGQVSFMAITDMEEPETAKMKKTCSEFFEIPSHVFSTLLDIVIYGSLEDVDHHVKRRQAMTLRVDEEIEYGRLPDAEELKSGLSRALCIWKMPYENEITIASQEDGSLNVDDLEDGNEYAEQIGLYILEE